jgi:hypothetical protein
MPQETPTPSIAQTQTRKARRQVVVVPLDEFMQEGLPVFDLGGERLGRVERYSLTAGYLKVKRDPLLLPQDLYVPFHLIRTIDPRELFLKVPHETLLAHYTSPPTMTLVVERVEEAGADGADGADGAPSMHVREQRHVRSGYDQTDVLVDTVDLTETAERLAIGMAVYDADGQRVGEVARYDSARAVMVVEQGVLKPRAFFIPFSVIGEVDATDMFVSLLIPQVALAHDYATLPPTEVSGTTRAMDPTLE